MDLRDKGIATFFIALATALLFMTFLPLPRQGMAASECEMDDTRFFIVDGVSTSEQRSAIAATGAVIVEVGRNHVLIEATPLEEDRTRSLGYALELDRRIAPLSQPVDPDYHTFETMEAEIRQVAADHGNIFALYSIGKTFEGRDLWLGKISDEADADEDEPEVLLTHRQHAREPITVEMALYTLHMLTDQYGQDARITHLVNTREIWIVFDMNPDGGEYDIASGSYRLWRKDRQPTPDSPCIGTDENRNWDYHWKCCHGSSGNPCSLLFRGRAPFSDLSTRALADFVQSRTIGGIQQIRTAIDFHAYGQWIMWPYGYTDERLPADMLPNDLKTMAAMGRDMARMNGYRAARSNEMYISDGVMSDWLYGAHRILAFTFELSCCGFYPSGSRMHEELARNRDAILYLIEMADCPYRAVGKGLGYCGSPVPVTDFSASLTRGVPPLDVDFKDFSSGEIGAVLCSGVPAAYK